MAHLEICPICWGEGKVIKPESKWLVLCHGCGGKGWVEVSDQPMEPIYRPIYGHSHIRSPHSASSAIELLDRVNDLSLGQ